MDLLTEIGRMLVAECDYCGGEGKVQTMWTEDMRAVFTDCPTCKQVRAALDERLAEPPEGE